MAKTTDISSKRIKLDKANATTVGVIAIASFVIVFCLFAIKALVSQYQYQSKVSSAQQTTVNQLNTDKTASSQLINSYKVFVNSSTNIIGGSSTGNGAQDGNNAKIILDALPSSYDFPALVTSVQNLLVSDGVNITGISGIDSSASGSTIVSSASGVTAPTTKGGPTAMPFTFSVSGPYSSIQSVINSLQNSIRPIIVKNVTISGTDSNLIMNVSAVTYYQNASGLSITTETIK